MLRLTCGEHVRNCCRLHDVNGKKYTSTLLLIKATLCRISVSVAVEYLYCLKI